MSELDAITIERVLVDAWCPAPDAEIIDRPDWAQLSTPSIPDTTANGVYLAKLAPDEADDRIAAVIQGHAARGAQFRWFVGPSSAPADLPDRLTRAGLLRLSHALGMSMAVPDRAPGLPAGLELREVTTLEDVETLVAIGLAAWQREPAFGEALRQATLRTFGREEVRHWIVWQAGSPIGLTTIRLLPRTRIGYFMGGAVVPERRGVGAYKAMLAQRLGLLRELGYEHAVTWAHAGTSAPILQRAGFAPRCEGVFFEWRGPG